MKVYIGPYCDRWVSYVHDKYMNKKYGWDWPEYGQKGMIHKTEPMREAFLRNLEDTLQWIYNRTVNLILGKRSGQKKKIRIDKYDTWSMDDTLAPIILPMLKQLKETKHGAPYVDLDDVPNELQPKKQTKKQRDNGETDSTHFERWDWVLDEMIWAFEQKCRDDWMEDFYYNKWDQEGVKAHQDRMSNGFKLFGKYFESLWD